jgi:hypothetical protein
LFFFRDIREPRSPARIVELLHFGCRECAIVDSSSILPLEYWIGVAQPSL